MPAPARVPANYWVHRTPTRTWTVGERRSSWIGMLAFLTLSEFRARYRAQALGIAWSVISPIAMMGALTVVLGPTFGRGGGYPMFLLVGLVIWNFVSTSTTAAIGSLVSKRELATRSQLSRQLIPLSVMLSYLINLGLESLTLLAFTPFLSGGIRLSPALLALPLLLGALVALLAGVALSGAMLNAMYRDVAYLASTGLLFLFWLTPVVYPLATVAEPYRTLLGYNPIAAILESIRGAALEGMWPTAHACLVIGVAALGALGIGLALFRRLEPAMLDHV